MRADLAERTPNPEPESEDAVLVARFRAGDRSAFDELVRRHQRGLFHLSRRYLPSDADAKDVVQRTFVKALAGLGGLRDPAALRAWLYQIAAHLALNHVRDRASLRPVGEAGEGPTVEAVGAARLEAGERRRALLADVARLPAQQRLIVELRVFDELPFREVAALAGCSENSAKVSFHHAVRRLREWATARAQGATP